MFFAALDLVIGYYYTRRLFSKHEEYLIDREDVKTFKELSSIKGNRVTAVPKEFTYAVSYFSEKEYSTKLEIDFDSRAIDLADIIIVNKELTEESLPRKLEDKGYSVRLEKERWIVYAC